MDETRNHVAIAAGNLHLGPALQHQEAFAVGMRLHLADLIEIDDGRTMDALEYARSRPAFEILHRFAQDQRIVAGVDAHVVAGRLDMLDRIHVDAEDLPAILGR